MPRLPELRYTYPYGRRHIVFTNKTTRQAEILFEDENNEHKLTSFVILGPHKKAYAVTDRCFLWAMRDAETYEVLCPGSDGTIIGKKVKNEPLPRDRWGEVISSLHVPLSAEVDILLPMFSLRDLAMQTVINSLKKKEDVPKLNLPRSINYEIVDKMIWAAENKKGNPSIFVEYMNGKCKRYGLKEFEPHDQN